MLSWVAHDLKRALVGVRLWQMLAALLCFALPLTLAPLAHSHGAPRWEQVVSWPGDQVVSRLVIGNANDGSLLFAVGAVSGVYESHDNGATWTRSMGLPHERAGVIRILDLAINPQTPEEIYAIVASSETKPRPMLYWSRDAGQTWQTRSSLGPRRVKGIAYSKTGQELYIATANEVLRAFITDGGQRYFIRNESDLARAVIADLEPKTEITLLLVNDAVGPYASAMSQTEGVAPRLVYIGAQGRGLQVVGDGIEIIDTDIAAMDSDTRTMRESATVYALCIDPLQPERLYAGTDSGLYISQDAGVTWRHSIELQGQPVLSLAFDAERGSLFAGLAAGGVWVSHDTGATWAILGDGLGRPSVFALGIADPESPMLYAATARGLWRAPLTELK